MPTPVIILILIALCVFVFIFLSILISLVTKSLFNGAYFAETSNDRMKDIFALAKLKPEDKVLDLGSGDGRILLATAKRGISATGIEINPLLVLISKLKLALAYPKPYSRATVKQGDLWQFKTKPYSVVIIYGIPSMMERLEKKLRKELKPGSRVISVLFEFPNLEKTRQKGEVHLYTM